MRASLVNLGSKLGKASHSKNVVTYHLSPFEQRAYAGALSKGLKNVWRRSSVQMLYWLPAAAFFVMFLHDGEVKEVSLSKKQEGQFDDE